jgi:hypothetical protein
VKASWKKSIAQVGRDLLEPAGFDDRPNATTYERRADGLRQGIEFQPGTGTLKDRFTINVYWTFDGDPDPDGFDFRERLGWFESGGDRWFSLADAERLTASMQSVAELLRAKVLPFLDRYRTSRAIVDAVDRNELDSPTAFGQDPGWRAWALARALAHAGERGRAIDALHDLDQIGRALDPRSVSPGYRAMLDRGKVLLEKLQLAGE